MSSCILYPATCGPKGHGGGLPLPGDSGGLLQITISSPRSTCSILAGLPALLPPIPSDKRKGKSDKKKKHSRPAESLLRPLSPPGLGPRLHLNLHLAPPPRPPGPLGPRSWEELTPCAPCMVWRVASTKSSASRPLAGARPPDVGATGSVKRRCDQSKADWKLRCIEFQYVRGFPPTMRGQGVLQLVVTRPLFLLRVCRSRSCFLGAKSIPSPFAPSWSTGRAMPPPASSHHGLSFRPRTSSLLFWTAGADRRCEPRRLVVVSCEL